jgi:hypothetical protein
MKKYLLSLLAIILIVPSVVFASWWNPFTWFSGTSKPNTAITISSPVPTPITPPTTSTSKINPLTSSVKNNTEKVTTLKVTTPIVSTSSVSGCNSAEGYSATTGLSCSGNGSCASGTTWNKSTGECITSLQYCQNQNGQNATYNSVNNSCGCVSGYTLNSNGICAVAKTGYQVCSESYSNETWDGTMVNGKYNCVCQTGYVWDNNQSSCQENNQTIQNNNSYKVCQQQTQINALNQQIIDIKTQYSKEIAGAQTTGTSVVAQGEVNRLTNEANQKIAQINLQIQQLQLNCQ